MSLDRLAWPDLGDDVVGVVGSALVEAAVGPVGVVVLDVLDEQGSELAFVPDDGAVQQFVAQGADPPLEARRSSYDRLARKIARLEPAGLLGDRSVDEALLQFQALCEGLGNFELRGDIMRILPAGAEDDAWRQAFRTLVAGFSAVDRQRRRPATRPR